MAKSDYVHMRYKNNAIACFSRTKEVVETNKAIEQFKRHGDTAEIWLYRSDIKDWHRYHIKEGKTNAQWHSYPESKVPATVVQYIKFTAE